MQKVTLMLQTLSEYKNYSRLTLNDRIRGTISCLPTSIFSSSIHFLSKNGRSAFRNQKI